MSWFRLDDQGTFHAKVVAAGNEAYGAWCRAGQWSSAHGTDGGIPEHIAFMIAPRRVWEKLIKVGLVEPRVTEMSQFFIHDFLVYNPSKAEQDERRAKRAAAGAIGGKRNHFAKTSKQVLEQVPSKSLANAKQVLDVCFDHVSTPVPSRPVPSRPVPSQIQIDDDGVRAHGREGNSAQDATTLAQDATAGTETTPPTQKRQEGPTTPRQPASPSRGQTVAVWMSPDEQVAGEKVLTALREAGGSGQDHGPLARVAEVKVVRELLKFSNVAGNMGRLGVDDIVAAVESVAERERQRMLVSMEVPKNEGNLSQWLISTVRGWRGNAAKVERQPMARKSKKLGQFDDDLSMVYNEATGQYERAC